MGMLMSFDFQLCFASLLSTPKTSLQNVVVSLFLRVLHSFAENVLAFASTHQVVTSRRSAALAARLAKSVAFPCRQRDSYNL